jgi:hypothetical protein
MYWRFLRMGWNGVPSMIPTLFRPFQKRSVRFSQQKPHAGTALLNDSDVVPAARKAGTAGDLRAFCYVN